MSDETFDKWWGRFVRSVAFLVGVGIMAYETIAEHSDRPWLYAAAIGMMGLPIARAAESVVGKLGKTSGPGSEDLPPAEGSGRQARQKGRKP